MLIGYARVSKADGSQTTDLQRDALLAEGVKEESIYQDHASGKRDDRPGLQNCLKALREGDILIVWKLDRLGRNLHHLVNTVHELTARKIGLKVLQVMVPLLIQQQLLGNWYLVFLQHFQSLNEK
ncbi:transposase (resolvase, DNA invertase) [Legionella donaldsonii]|uniref:Transposase (Resolvase, DNA invertase) n=1 Tax=Legionella donaldsonii TaxID=45060 RepID=A0A378KNE5_9GAMM|nr:transposase (resolvase, DNA invertase) [Legionella donaldsonii]